jgi:hypothetical protein
MSETLKRKIAEALANPNIPLQLTAQEAAELDTYIALVSYFESQNIELTGGNA